ncbi:hypothetical protein BD410DRAFT_795986 [Rickenella mellea]|uniref:Signal recognition particle subunit SRP68 n=1 Tax=Rickenella mellea TaxID=50990 RepID=A0A4Y7PKT8_9AGAM|nr:hypothetical protein BD410DRAFT_795986 [Rickenella mellea]
MSKGDSGSNGANFRALRLANEHRNAYGLRYNDHNRYRNHCANKTHRLRSTLKMTHGKGRDFKKLPPLTLENIKDGHLQLLLFESERAWSYSQELYASSLQPTNSAKAATLRHSATGRFRRSVHWSTQLLSHCQSLYSAKQLSAENLLEVTTYTLILNGRFLRFRDEFEDALDQLCVARDLLDSLEDNAQTSRDQALATLFSDEISPEIRYCAHELGHTKSYDVDDIVKEISPRRRTELVVGYEDLVGKLKAEMLGDKSKEGRKLLKPILWERKEIPVRNPELVDILLKVQEAESRLEESQSKPNSSLTQTKAGKQGKSQRSRNGVAAYDGVLSALSDADDVARKLLEAQQASGSANAIVPGTRDIHFLHAYIVYQLLSRRIQRDLTLVSALVSVSSQKQTGSKVVKQQEEGHDVRINPAVVKLLDTVLQSLTQMRTLNVVDESPDLANAVEARVAFTKTRRCIYLSRSYAAVKKYPEALSLTQRAQLYLREASSLHSADVDPITSGTPPFYSLTTTTFSSLEESLTSDETQFKREWFAYNGGATSAERDPSKKPLFFDIALNYVQLDVDRLQERTGKRKVASQPAAKAPAQEHKIGTAKAKVEEERVATPEPKQAPRGGLSSLLGGWWGRQ